MSLKVLPLQNDSGESMVHAVEGSETEAAARAVNGTFPDDDDEEVMLKSLSKSEPLAVKRARGGQSPGSSTD